MKLACKPKHNIIQFNGIYLSKLSVCCGNIKDEEFLQPPVTFQAPQHHRPCELLFHLLCLICVFLNLYLENHKATWEHQSYLLEMMKRSTFLISKDQPCRRHHQVGFLVHL